jgi:hypothetical protein
VDNSVATPAEIAGAISVTGTGADQVFLNQAAAPLTFGSSVTVTDNYTAPKGSTVAPPALGVGGSGVTEFLGALKVTGMSNIYMGEGQPDRYDGGVSVSAGTEPTFILTTGGGGANATVAGSLSITGAPDSIVTLNNINVLGNLVVNYGAASAESLSSLTIDPTCSIQTFTYTGLRGPVTLDLDGYFLGNSSITLGSGNSTVTGSASSTRTWRSRLAAATTRWT